MLLKSTLNKQNHYFNLWTIEESHYATVPGLFFPSTWIYFMYENSIPDACAAKSKKPRNKREETEKFYFCTQNKQNLFFLSCFFKLQKLSCDCSGGFSFLFYFVASQQAAILLAIAKTDTKTTTSLSAPFSCVTASSILAVHEELLMQAVAEHCHAF